ncbi:MAG: hypothetical protein RBS40_01250 [Rhodocyclaceae bacterium]|jgi:hypothetical protein|nr:hypothetical protein [Rhodocyclaceae bacterium]
MSMAQPDYRNPAECLERLQRLHLTDLAGSHRTLREMVATLLQFPPAPNQHLEVLETARPHIAFVQGELGNRYAAHPLPPDSTENATLLQVAELWSDLANSCGLILQRDAEFHTLADQHALLAQRRLHYAGQVIVEYYRAHRSVPAGAWLQLHRHYQEAEKMGVARVRVADPLNEVWRAQSSGEAYVATLLVDVANPFSRGEREFNWVCRWAQRFAPYCTLSNPAEGEAPGKYGLDLGQDHGLRPGGLLAAAPTLRRFDSQRLAGQIQAIMTQFKQGVSPATLGLGEDCPADVAARLLLSLYRPWGLAAAGRKYPRRGSRGAAQVTVDWPAIAFYIEGRPFEAPRAGNRATSLETDLNFMTFGARVENTDDWDDHRRAAVAREKGYFCLPWQVADQSVGGFRVQRHPQGERTEHHQLVGVRPPDGDQFLLGRVSWLMFRQDGMLEAGIQMLPGLPRVVAVRTPGVGSDHREAYHLAFMLPPVPALKTEASLVLPSGWFRPERLIEIHGEPPLRVQLTKLVERGANFDQVSFTSVA